MARPLRLAFEGAVYHVMARGNRKEDIFLSERDKKIFLDKLAETFSKFSITCYAYCLMNNHYHLFMKTASPNISAAMHFLNSSYVNWFKNKHKVVGVVFQGRYKSILVEEDAYALQLSAYIHLNPLRTGIVHSPELYRWSSYSDYLRVQTRAIAGLDTTVVLAQISKKVERCQGLPETERIKVLQEASAKYSAYVLSKVNMKNPLGEAYKGTILGGHDFVEKIKNRIVAMGKNREIPVTRMRISRPYLSDDLLARMADALGIDREMICARSGIQRRNIYFQLYIYLLKKRSELSLKEIGRIVDMDYVAVHQVAKRFERKIRIDTRIRAIKEKVEEVCG